MQAKATATVVVLTCPKCDATLQDPDTGSFDFTDVIPAKLRCQDCNTTLTTPKTARLGN